ncbi:hypothetical protein AJ79_05843 [Helicocarpus griseus UAMH5409]|uniref:Cytochrome P450 monooxygenase n=1 Tax=Helicocarpus griseus UAMH5409 TaxID=1447875 RepID=A0A2B7XIV2_9EURO|nr:hypothetical protein AJ79_05843 [Helicocarpus griseus UAMH5409]
MANSDRMNDNNSYSYLLLAGVLGLAIYFASQALQNLFWHPLSSFPGPKLGTLTRFYKAYIDGSPSKSFVHALKEFHGKYGDVVRVGPNELHFSDPSAYFDIYNPSNRWDKEETLYHSFGEDRSSFGFLTYKEAKERRDLLARRFSKKAVHEVQDIVQEKVEELCASFERNCKTGPINLFYAFRCMSTDVITYLCFGKSIDAVHAPKHEAPIVKAMDASLAAFVCFKHSPLYKNMIMKCPPNLSKIISPATAGLVDLQVLLRKQIEEITNDPSELAKLPHSQTVYHELLSPEAYHSGTVPSSESLYEEAQALLFGGADTTGTTLMHGSFYILTLSDVYRRLKAELLQAWPDLDQPPRLSVLEKLPYLTAVIKESMRMSPGVASPLPRVVPAAGATISGKFVPGGTVVEMSSQFVHRNESVFEKPNDFIPDRWMGDNGQRLDKWLVNFSRGPRQCLGRELAWAELYLCFAHVYRRFDLTIHSSSPKALEFRDCFLPDYIGPHLRADLSPVAA